MGYFSDRASSRKTHYLLGLLALLLSTVLVALARRYALLLVARFLQGSSSAIVWTVGTAVLADTFPTEQLGVAMGTIGSVVSLAMVAGPVFGGAIFHRFGYSAVFWGLGGLLVFDVVLRLLMIELKDAKKWGVDLQGQESQESAEATPNETTQLLDGSASKEPATSLLKVFTVYLACEKTDLCQSARFLNACWMAFVVSVVFSGPIDAVLPLHLKETFDFNALTSGAAFIALALPEVVLGPVSGLIVDRYGPRLAALIGYITLCPSLFLFILPTGPASPSQIALLIAVLTFNGCSTAMIGGPAMAEITLQLRTGKGDVAGMGYAQGYGLFNLAWSMGTLGGPLIAGWMMERWGWDVLCIVLGIVAGGTVIPAYLFTGGKDKEEKSDLDGSNDTR